MNKFEKAVMALGFALCWVWVFIFAIMAGLDMQ